MTMQYQYIKAAQLISHADGLIIAAGAGMGVDSGLPDFRGDTGFWKHYPALQKSGINFIEMASPSHFCSSPQLAWGFYGHRLALYRDTQPHLGFQILHDIAGKLPHNAFVFTSNVDGHFQKAGFLDGQILECHGSINHLQCLSGCDDVIWSAHDFLPIVDNENCRLINDPPICKICGLIARPNILMFNDMDWISERTDQQYQQLQDWLHTVRHPVVIELGAGTAISTVRSFAERLGVPLIRVNVREAQIPSSPANVSLPTGALQAMNGIKQALDELHFF